MTNPFQVLDFWWRAGSAKWFARNDAFDTEIRSRFMDAIEAAQEGDLDGWAETPHGSLALIILLDQFTRNVYREDPRSFAADAKAVAIATSAVDKGFDKAFPMDGRAFFYLPFEHAEDMELQQKSVDLFRRLNDDSYYMYALAHMDVIRRFGRFPHRNKILWRETTPEEQAYLDDGGFSA